MSFSGGLPSAIMELIEQHGGVQGLLQQFEQNGLGDVVRSWIGNGHNQSVSPDQIQRTLDPNQLNDAAQKSGLSVDELIRQLSNVLPQTVDHLTPSGQVASSGWMDTALRFLSSRLS